MSYVYSTYPIPAIDTASSHTGFYVVLAICIVVALASLILAFEDGDIDRAVVTGAVCFIVTGITAVISWNTGSVTTYENTPVAARMVEFQSEGYNERQGSGKARRRVDVHRTYIVYEVDNIRVMFPADTSVGYPENATLYRNPRAQ